MNLTQQLEDKKKGCGSLFIDENGNDAPCKLLLVDRVEPEPHFCPTCKSNIAILEQAIAEMQKQRQEILDLIDKIEPEIKKDLENPDLKRDEKGIVSGTCHLIKLKIIQQLNQPKTEE